MCVMKGSSIAGKGHEDFEPGYFLQTTRDLHIRAQFITFGATWV